MKRLHPLTILLAILITGAPSLLHAQPPTEGAEQATSGSATAAPSTKIKKKKKKEVITTTITTPTGKEVTQATIIEPPKSRISGDLGVSLLNQYNTRGIIVQSKGVIYQPYGDLYLNVYHGDGFINRVSLQAGFWADLSSDTKISNPTVGNAQRHFTELDFLPGVSVQFLKRFNFTLLYDNWITPAGGYGSGQWIQGIIGYDDSNQLIKNFSFQPLFKALYELPSDTPAGLGAHAWYFEPSITPNYTFFSSSKYPLNVGLNGTLGLGKQFYAGDTFGYLAVGPQVSVPLGFIPSDFGKWTLSAGYRYYYLGNTTAAVAPGGDHSQSLYSVSLGLKF